MTTSTPSRETTASRAGSPGSDGRTAPDLTGARHRI
jgi:hypothetical protein